MHVELAAAVQRGEARALARALTVVENDPEASYRLAVEMATELCESLRREGVDHFHFYTLNQTDMCLDISLALGASLNPARIPSAA